MTTTADDVWRLLGELIEAQKETSKQLKETSEQLKKTDEQQKKTDEQQKKTDRKIKELGKQIGGLGIKFGSFTEGLALPSMTKILTKKLAMDVISPRVKVRVLPILLC